MATTTETGLQAPQFLQLMAFMSPAFPTGGFAYSHGLEWVIDAGEVTSPEDVRAWIAALLVHGSGWNDAVLFACAFAANEAARKDIDELALALAASRERALETSDLGQSFAKAAAIWPDAVAEYLHSYPVVVASVCKAVGFPKQLSLLAFLQAFSNNLIAVAVRLVPLGQTKGLEIMRDLMPIITATADRAMAATLADLGSSTLLSDVAAMRHETQYSRVFRS